MKREWCLVHEYWASEDRHHEERCGRSVRSGECTFREAMTKPTMVTDAEVAAWCATDFFASISTPTGSVDADLAVAMAKRASRLLADRKRWKALLKRLWDEYSGNDETEKRMALLDEAEKALKEAHGA